MSQKNILEIKNLSLDFITPWENIQAIRNINLSIPDNKVVGLAGESGCGKSTVVSAIMQLLAPNTRIRSGRILFDNKNLMTLSENEMRHIRGQEISMVFQDPMTSQNPVITIGKQMTDILYSIPNLSLNQKKAMVIDMLGKVGISDPEMRYGQYAHEFSGGMRQRICIAMAMLTTPRLFIADEPITALDVTTGMQIIDLLRKMKSEYQNSGLFVSHNFGLIAELCDEVVIMYAGEVVERGRVEEVFYNPCHPYTKCLLKCDPSTIKKATRNLPTIQGSVPQLSRRPPGCIFEERCSESGRHCHDTHPKELYISETHAFRCFPENKPRQRGVHYLKTGTCTWKTDEKTRPGESNPSSTLLSIKNVRVRFRSAGFVSALINNVKDPFIDACLDINIDIQKGETFGLVGESGSGKTTLGLSIMGLRNPSAGSICFSGQDILHQNKKELKNTRQQIAMMFQDPIASLSPRMTARELVMEPFEIHRVRDVDLDREAERLFSMVGLSTDLYTRYPHELSGGQARRIGVARALALNPKLIIADEPTAGLDVSVQADILNLMGTLQKQLGLSYLVISHNLPVIRHISDKLAIMYLGIIVEQGDSDVIFKHPGHPYTELLLSGILVPDPARRKKYKLARGDVPSLKNRPKGCEFSTRCPYCMEQCKNEAPEKKEIRPGHFIKCHRRLPGTG